MSQIDEANAEGLRITAQVRSRPTSVLLGLELSQNPFMGRPSYKRIAHLPFPERLAHFRQPDFRARSWPRRSRAAARPPVASGGDRMYPLGDPPEYEPKAESRPLPHGRHGKPLARRGSSMTCMLERDGQRGSCIYPSPTMPRAIWMWCGK